MDGLLACWPGGQRLWPPGIRRRTKLKAGAAHWPPDNRCRISSQLGTLHPAHQSQKNINHLRVHLRVCVSTLEVYIITDKKYSLFCLWLLAALQRKSQLCISRKGIARPQSQYPHSCVCEQFQDRSTYFPVVEKAVADRGNIYSKLLRDTWMWKLGL